MCVRVLLVSGFLYLRSHVTTDDVLVVFIGVFPEGERVRERG